MMGIERIGVEAISRRSRLVAVSAVLALTLSACSVVRLEQLPAPKGVSGPTYHIVAQFHDVQNLTEGAKVKLQGVVVGAVTSISTHDFLADVSMIIEKKFTLASSATFQVRFTTPLGEDFVAVTTPDPTGLPRMADGTTVPVKQTGDAPGIEDTFAALSLLLNGGGLSKLQTIARELDAALTGRTGSVRDAVVQLHTVIANFDEHKSDFDKTLDGLQKMSVALNKGNGVVSQALTQFPDTIQLLADDTAQIRNLLVKVGKLGDTVSAMLQRSQSDMLANFDALRPTLDSLKASSANLIPTFDSLITFGKLIDRAAPGDYLNLSATIEFLLSAPAQRPKAGGSVAPQSASASDAMSTLLTGGLR